MVDIDDLQGNVIPVIIFILVIGLVFSLVASFGVPLISGTDTFDAPEVMSVHETSNETIFTLDDPSLQDEVVAKVNGNEVNWQGGKIRVDSSKTDIVFETYPGGEGLYSTHEYERNEHQVALTKPSAVLAEKQYNYMLRSGVSEARYESTRWRVDGELVQTGGVTYISAFEEPGNYTLQVQTNIGDKKYTRTKKVEVLKPDEIVLDTNITSTDVLELESFDLNVTEVTKQGIDTVDVNWGDGEQITTNINESLRYWYDKPGNYNITVSAESQQTGATTQNIIPINVSERPEDNQNISTLSVGVFDEGSDPISNAVVNVGSGKTKQTDGQGITQFEVSPGEYDVTVSKSGFVTDRRTVLVIEDTLIETGLDTVDVPEVDNPSNNETGLTLNESVLEFNNETEVNSTELETITQEGLLPDVLESMNGNGTESSPYQITNYVELQAVSVQPNAYYEVTNNINAGISQDQNTETEIGPVEIGTAGRSVFELESADEKPISTTVTIDGQQISPEKYEVITPGVNDPSLDSDRVYLVFTNDEGQQTAAQDVVENVRPDSSVEASYTLSDPVSRGFDTINAGNSIIRIDGNGHQVSNLEINRPNEDTVGIFDTVGGGYIRNLDITADVTGAEDVGVLFGGADNVNVKGVSIGGSVEGDSNVGSVVGSASGVAVTESSVFSGVTGEENVGGVIGTAGSEFTVQKTGVDHLSSDNSVSGSSNVGGVVGRMGRGSLRNSYAKTAVTATSPTIESVGGIAGEALPQSQIRNTYSVLTTINTPESGESEIVNAGQIAGTNRGSIEGSYWDSSVAPQSAQSAVGDGQNGISNNNVGLETSQMQGSSATSNMDNLDFESTWIESEEDYPVLSGDGLDVQDPSISITSISSGDDVSLEPNIEISVTNFELRPSSTNEPGDQNAGHAAIIVGDPYTQGNEVPQETNGIYHLSEGGTSTTIDLQAGENTITAQLLDDNHTSTAYYETIFVNAADQESQNGGGGGGGGGGDGDGDDDSEGDDQAQEDVTISMVKNDNDDYTVSSVSPTDLTSNVLQDDEIGDPNPDLSLTTGERYAFELSQSIVEEDPIEIVTPGTVPLLSMEGGGSYEDDENVDWSVDGTTVRFTATNDLLQEADAYSSTETNSNTGSIDQVGGTRSLSIDVLDHYRDPITGASVEITKDGEIYASKENTDEGTFFTEFETGEYDIDVESDDFQDRTIQDYEHTEDSSLDIDLIPPNFVVAEFGAQGTSAYTVESVRKEVSRSILQEDDLGDSNPTLNLEQGVRYRFKLEDIYNQHPIEIVSLNDQGDVDEVLLSADVDGSLEDDSDIDWMEQGSEGGEEVGLSDRDDDGRLLHDSGGHVPIEFTATEELLNRADAYRCGFHGGQMRGDIE